MAGFPAPPGNPSPGAPHSLRPERSLTRAAGRGTSQGRSKDEAGEQQPQQPQVPRGRRRDGCRHASAPPPGQHGTPQPRARYPLREPRLEKPGSERGGGGRGKEEAAALTLRQWIRDGMEARRPEKSVGSAPARSTCGGGTSPPVRAPSLCTLSEVPFLQAAECFGPLASPAGCLLITQESGLELTNGGRPRMHAFFLVIRQPNPHHPPC